MSTHLYTVTFDCANGTTLYEAAREAYELMKDQGMGIFVVHNDKKYKVDLAVSPVQEDSPGAKQ